MMPMPSPQWYQELPEFITEEEYRDLSEEISRTIEVVFGHVIKCESPTRRHQRIARVLANALASARSPVGPCLEVDTNTDVVLGECRALRFSARTLLFTSASMTPRGSRRPRRRCSLSR